METAITTIAAAFHVYIAHWSVPCVMVVAYFMNVCVKALAMRIAVPKKGGETKNVAKSSNV